MKKYIKSTDFDDFGHSIDPKVKKTNYKYYLPDLDIDGTVEEIYQEVLNNYVIREDSLLAIQEILLQNGWMDEAKIVGYYIDELREILKNDDTYSWSRVKIDIAQGYTKSAGFEQRPWGDFLLSCWVDRDAVIIQLEDYSGSQYGSGVTSLPISEFMVMSPKDLDDIVGQLNAYGMEYTEDYE